MQILENNEKATLHMPYKISYRMKIYLEPWLRIAKFNDLRINNYEFWYSLMYAIIRAVTQNIIIISGFKLSDPVFSEIATVKLQWELFCRVGILVVVMRLCYVPTTYTGSHTHSFQAATRVPFLIRALTSIMANPTKNTNKSLNILHDKAFRN